MSDNLKPRNQVLHNFFDAIEKRTAALVTTLGYEIQPEDIRVTAAQPDVGQPFELTIEPAGDAKKLGHTLFDLQATVMKLAKKSGIAADVRYEEGIFRMHVKQVRDMETIVGGIEQMLSPLTKAMSA